MKVPGVDSREVTVESLVLEKKDLSRAAINVKRKYIQEEESFYLLLLFLNFYFNFIFFMAAPVAYGNSQARGQIGATSVTHAAARGNAGSLTH